MNNQRLSAAEPVKAGGSITLMASQNWIKDVDRELFKKFQDETGTEVKILVTPDNGFDTLLGTSLSGGSNAIDMFMFPAGSKMISAGVPDLAVDLSGEAWIANQEDWAKIACSYKDVQYGFSTWGVDYEGMLYNKTYFEENKLAVPTTWVDFLALCDQIKALGKTPLYENINGVWHTNSWFYALTPQLYKENPNFIADLNSSKDKKYSDFPVVKKGLTQLYDFFSAKENGKPKYYTNDGQSEDWFGSYPALINRDNVMLFTYSAYAAELAAKGSKDVWGMFPLPVADNDTVVSNGGGVAKFINKNGQNIESCKALLNFLAKPENIDTFYAGRTDLVTASFKGVTTVSATTATINAKELSKTTPPTHMAGDTLYWDPDMYKYFQGFAEGSTSVDQFITNIDAYRATMFDAVANKK